LQSLVDKSLLRYGDDERYWMLETIREYAGERLEGSGELDEVRELHARHFIAFAKHQSQAAEPTASLRPEIDNFRAALIWLRQTGARPRELELATALFDLWVIAGHAREGRKAVQDALTGAHHPPQLRASALKVAGDLALDHGDYAAARTLLEQAHNLSCELGPDERVASCLTDLGHVAKCERDFPRAEALFARSIDIARTLDDRLILAEALVTLVIASSLRATTRTPPRCAKKASASTRRTSLLGGGNVFVQPWPRAAAPRSARTSHRRVAGKPHDLP
jgi:hypothetical protein